MKLAVICVLLAVATAAPSKGASETSTNASSTDSNVKELLAQALADRPKKARQLFSTGAYKRALRRRAKQVRAEGESEEADVDEKGILKGEELGQEDGWSPISLSNRRLAKARGLSEPAAEPSSDLSEDVSIEPKDSVSGDSSEDSVSGDAQEEDREAEDSLLSPLYAPPPGYQHYGGSYGPYIYILPIVLPPPSHGHPGPAHVVTETGHESHHYSAGTGHHQYRPLYAGAQGVPPIYIPKGYGFQGGHGALHGGHGVHGKHGGHTTVHHEDKTIVRDIHPPIFKA